MQIVSVKFKSKSNQEQFSSKEYGYFVDFPVKEGDLVVAPTKNGESVAQVTGLNIDENNLRFDKNLLKVIIKPFVEEENISKDTQINNNELPKF